jgi:hypothetical protein
VLSGPANNDRKACRTRIVAICLGALLDHRRYAPCRQTELFAFSEIST